MSGLHHSSPFHSTFSNLFFSYQQIPKVFQKHPSTYLFTMRFCSLNLLHKPLFLQFISLLLLSLKTCSDFLHLKNVSHNTAFLQNYSSSISFILNFLTLLFLLYFLNSFQSSRYLLYLISRNLYSVMFIVAS